MEPSDHDKLAYFQPGEMVYLISHKRDRLIDAPIDKLIGWSNNLASNPALGRDLKLTISRRPERELHFPGTIELAELPKQEITIPPGIQYKLPQPERRGAFSIIPAEVRDETDPEKNPDGYVDTSKLAELIVRLDNARDLKDQPLLEQEITLEVVSPNWLSSPGSEWGGGGGPGSRPVPYTGATDTAPYEFQLPPNIEKLCPEKARRGEGVKVAIFDTVPCLHDLAEAYERYHRVNPQNQPEHHPLIESLLKPNGPLTVHPASYEELLRMRSVHLRDHNYNMTDHGLFVAGIIHSIVPAAEIHLYEVLNPDGVGDLESIARGLWKVADEQYRMWTEDHEVKRLVVNCSLVLRIPLDGDPKSPNSAKPIQSAPPLAGHRLTDLDQVLLDKILTDPLWVKRAGLVIMWICDRLFWLGSRVIAAAGNDWKPKEDKGRPQARYPAAFNSVLGIGALPKDKVSKDKTPISNAKRKTASYSNLSDEPGEVGVTTLGGELGEEQGILGVYLGKFPSPYRRSRNTTNWAWWSGTSFATPILTGAIAAVLSGLAQPAITQDAIAIMYRDSVIVNDQTDYQEDMLDVTQG